MRTEEEVRRTYRELAARLGAVMTGAIVQPMLAGGVEMIVGGVNYAAFGSLVMAGMSGMMADLLADRSFRVPPVTGAERMLGELRRALLLHGYRGMPAVDIKPLTGQIRRVGRLLDDLPQVAELDLNPLIASPDGAVTVTPASGSRRASRRPRRSCAACAYQRPPVRDLRL
ncbi:acetate--CoA ligase family protein [Nonomuraea sp. NPDC048826]|uniref:acetate--CoA ligase family protein n=1 Tax=Nonomuraea sp. NPDC048826 TaxID=3364347 RepID=UPI003724662D